MTINEALDFLTKQGISYEVSNIKGFDYMIPSLDEHSEDTHLTEKQFIEVVIDLQTQLNNLSYE